VLRIPVLPGSIVAVLQALWKLMLALSCIGLCTRFSTLGAFLLGSYLLALPHNYGKVHHQDALLVFVQGVMALARCGDAWSVDRWLGTARRPDHRSTGSLAFFGAGLSKMKRAGVAWIASDSLATLLTRCQYNVTSARLASWGARLAGHRQLCRLLAAMTVAFEIGYPLALARREARWIVLPGACAMLAIIRALMGPSFGSFVICHVFWVPWDRLGRWLSSRLRAGVP
jgi:hypothetical protein